MPMPIMPAAIFPQVDSDCSKPSAGARVWSGTESATSATESPKTPPTPIPVRNRYAEKSQNPVENALKPVNSEYNRTQMLRIFARP